MPLSGQSLIRKYTKLSDRPEYYSGRGATLTDLDSQILEQAYRGVLEQYGKEAARQFCQLVYDLKILAATVFLNEFYCFVDRGCIWSKPVLPEGSLEARGIDLGSDRDARYAIGQAVVAMAMAGGLHRDETEQIRSQFVHRHHEEITEDPKRGRPCLYAGSFR